MILRAAAIWLLVLVIAILNGAAREAWLIPRFGDTIGRALSTLSLSALIFLITWLSIGWIDPKSAADALRVGLFWLVLTLAFEFLAGHYLFKKPWNVLLEDYDLRRGRSWVIVLVAALLAPWLTARMRGLPVVP